MPDENRKEIIAFSNNDDNLFFYVLQMVAFIR